MKRILGIIYIFLIALTAQSQNTVLNKNGDLIEGRIKSYSEGKLIFQEYNEVINSNFIKIDQVLEIHGPLLISRKSAILADNPKVRFFNEANEEITTEEITDQDMKNEYRDPLYYTPVSRIQNDQRTISGNSNKISKEDQLAYELSHTRECLMNYRREKLTGFWMTIGGGVIVGASLTMYNNGDLSEESASIGYWGGGIMMITGEVLQLTCNKWLKSAYFGPSDNGIGLKVRF